MPTFRSWSPKGRREAEEKAPGGPSEAGLWYSGGLRFECLRCGRCCTGEPGRVEVSDEEIKVLAARIRLPEAEFRARYTRRSRGPEVLLIEKRNRDCVFFDAKRGCSVYADRPRQCRTWPFWASILESPESWHAQSARCRGMNRGSLHSLSEIRLLAANDGISGS